MTKHIYVFACAVYIGSLWYVGKSIHYRDEKAIKAFGKKVRDLRTAKGMTIEEFANTIELHTTQLSRIERGETNVTLSYIMFLAKALGVKPGELL